MDKILLRLECLKMAMALSEKAGIHDMAEICKMAKEFEHYAQDIELPKPEAK